jgi:4-diphosphocytidyl-2-C-methyl-D-erythritol kinase
MEDGGAGARGSESHADVSIHIEKQACPSRAVLGAGSANAVAALLGLESRIGHSLSPLRRWQASQDGAPPVSCSIRLANWGAERLEIAAQVGSDVPLFLIGGAVLGLDRGQQVFPARCLKPTWCVVATPAVGVSTPQAFRDWDALCEREGLTQRQVTLN